MKAIFEEALRLKRAYAQYGQHHGTKYALKYARQTAAPEKFPIEWRDGRNHPVLAIATFEHGPFMVTLTLEYDDNPDWSYIGEFGMQWRPGCIDIRVADGGQHHGRYGHDCTDFDYFYPATDYGNLDWREMKKVLSGDSTPCDLHVVVSRNGIDLAEGWLGGGVYGYGMDPADVFLGDECGMIEEALDEASETFLELCPA